MKTALGFRTHSGWAAVVTIELSPEPSVCERLTVVLADARIHGSKQPFHTAEQMPLAKARAFLKRCERRSYALAAENLKNMVKTWQHRGREIVACGLIDASGRVPDSVEAILASHAAIHSAEGELYRDAIAHACDRASLPLLRIKQKEILSSAAEVLGKSIAQIESVLLAMGRDVGPPWGEDQKLAALAAWVALATSTGQARRKAAGARA